MAERRPSVSYTPAVIPQLAGLEKPQDHALKIDHCDVLIMGTGLVESILAAALAWQGVEVLHIDANTFYGDTSSTLTIEQLKRWCVEVNHGHIKNFHDAQIYVPAARLRSAFKSSDYGIDLNPRIMFCQSDLLALLVKSRVYKYLEFQSVSNFHMFENDDFCKRNTSLATKEDIFTDKSLSLSMKRYLMKFLKFVLADNSDPEKQKVIQENAKTGIKDFLTGHFSLGESQANELMYLIGLCESEFVYTPVALAKIQRFLVSFNIHGNFPVMVSKYGGPGEISQGFCRSAAVAGTTYKLSTSLTDYDPDTKIASFNDGSRIKIKEKIVISPTQVPKFLLSGYKEASQRLRTYNVTRLVTVVSRDCREWMTDNESSTVVVFPPHSLPTNNSCSVQVMIQNGGSGVCPQGQSIWFSHTCEQAVARAKNDLESAFDKMVAALLRELRPETNGIASELAMDSVPGSPTISSFRVGSSLLNFVPKVKVDIICKLGYVEQTHVNPDLTNVFHPTTNNSILLRSVSDTIDDDIVFTNMPSSEISYDGIISEAKCIYQRITCTDDDFFDVDFEDEEEDDPMGSSVPSAAQALRATASDMMLDNDVAIMLDNDMAIEDDDEDHHAFGAGAMEL